MTDRAILPGTIASLPNIWVVVALTSFGVVPADGIVPNKS